VAALERGTTLAELVLRLASPPRSKSLRSRTALRRTLDERTGDFRAIETVLHAERDAERAVEQAGHQASAVVARARERANEITQRADVRIRRLLAQCATAADMQIDGLHAAHERRLRAVEHGPSDEGLAAAVARLADWLLGDAATTEQELDHP
jgi:vacuolar-type H+-ATPase subunit H